MLLVLATDLTHVSHGFLLACHGRYARAQSNHLMICCAMLPLRSLLGLLVEPPRAYMTPQALV